MPRAFRVFWAAIRDFFDEFLLLSVCNLIWAVVSLPLLVFAFLAISQEGGQITASIAALLAALPMGPASAGLAALAQRISEGRTVKFADFFSAMRRYARPSWVIMGLWMLGLLIIFFDLAFYGQMDNLLGAVLWGIWLYILIIWVALQIYLFPLLMLQEKPDLRLLIRNALIMCLGRPIFTITTLVLMSILMAVSITFMVPFVLVTISLFAVWGMRAATSLIEAERERRAVETPTATTTSIEEKGRRGQVRPK